MNAYIHTSLVGGTEGDLFNDILKLSDAEGMHVHYTPDTTCHANESPIVGQLNVDTQDPIRRIDVSHGWEVCLSSHTVLHEFITSYDLRLMASRSGTSSNSPVPSWWL